MNIDNYFRTVVDSDPRDWLTVSRPSFFQSGVWGSRGTNPETIIGLEEHHTVYTFGSDLSISIAVGLPWDDGDVFGEEWTRGFPDREATAHWVDFCWNGRPIFRSLRVLVDGARCGLPAPRAGTKEVPEGQKDVYRLIAQLDNDSDYDTYFSRAGLVTVGVPWPR